MNRFLRITIYIVVAWDRSLIMAGFEADENTDAIDIFNWIMKYMIHHLWPAPTPAINNDRYGPLPDTYTKAP